MNVEVMIREHNDDQYEGPNATVCSACGDVVRKVRDRHACPDERRIGLERRIKKDVCYMFLDFPVGGVDDGYGPSPRMETRHLPQPEKEGHQRNGYRRRRVDGQDRRT